MLLKGKESSIFLELAVSAKSEILFLNGNDGKVEKQKLQSKAIGSNQQQQVFVIEDGLNENQSKLTSINGNKLNHSSQYFQRIPGVFSVLPDPIHNRILLANSSQISVLENSLTTKVYHGQSIQDLVIDYCQSFLYVVDKGRLFQSSLKDFSLVNNVHPTDQHIQLVAMHFYLTQNLEINHRDGFTIKSLKTGDVICHSSASKSFTIRSMITYGAHQIYLLDAQSGVIWNLDTDKTGKTCDLKVWQHIPTSQQLLDMVILNNTIDCISEQDEKDQYKPQQGSSTTTSSPDFDPCHNFCIHGTCKQTSLNIPVCHCPTSFTGERCEIGKCHNFCLNGGSCNMTLLDAPLCKCPDGYGGSRCETKMILSQEIPKSFNYQEAFLVSACLCVTFFVILLGLFVLLIKTRKSKNTPQIITKSPRTRVFSTSSNRSKRYFNIIILRFKSRLQIFTVGPNPGSPEQIQGR